MMFSLEVFWLAFQLGYIVNVCLINDLVGSTVVPFPAFGHQFYNLGSIAVKMSFFHQGANEKCLKLQYTP